MMHYRDFGRTGWSISEICFGAWQLGGQWGAVDDGESISTLLAAYEAGVNLVDTAQMYGDGHSEIVVGRSLRSWKGDRIRIATKIPPLSWPNADEADADIAQSYPEQYLRERVDDSLARLGVDCIDLLQLHCWMPSGLVDLRWFETLTELKQAGKIQRIGASLRDYRPQDGIELARSGLVDSIQVVYNLFEQLPEVELFPAAHMSGTAIMARAVLDSGALSGAWTERTYESWEPGSVLHTMFRDERFEETLDRVARLTEAVRPYCTHLAEAAIRFALDPREVSTAIIGMSRSSRVAGNVALSDGKRLPPALRAQLAEHQWRRNYYL